MKPSILCVDDESDITKAVELHLLNEDVDIDTYNDPREGLAAAEKKEYSLALVDIRMPGMTGIEFLSKLSEISPRTVKINMSSHADLNVVLEALSANHVYDFIKKPLKRDKFLASVRKALAYSRLVLERDALSETLKEKNQELEAWNSRLDDEVKKKTLELSLRDALMQHLSGCINGCQPIYSIVSEYFQSFYEGAEYAIYIKREKEYSIKKAYTNSEKVWKSTLMEAELDRGFHLEKSQSELLLIDLERHKRKLGALVLSLSEGEKALPMLQNFSTLLSLVIYDELASEKVADISLNLLDD